MSTKSQSTHQIIKNIRNMKEGPTTKYLFDDLEKNERSKTKWERKVSNPQKLLNEYYEGICKDVEKNGFCNLLLLFKLLGQKQLSQDVSASASASSNEGVSQEELKELQEKLNESNKLLKERDQSITDLKEAKETLEKNQQQQQKRYILEKSSDRNQNQTNLSELNDALDELMQYIKRNVPSDDTEEDESDKASKVRIRKGQEMLRRLQEAKEKQQGQTNNPPNNNNNNPIMLLGAQLEKKGEDLKTFKKLPTP